MPPANDHVKQSQGNGHTGKPTVAALAKAKQLPVQFLRDCGLSDQWYGVRIAYLDAAGLEMRPRKRLHIIAKEGSKWGQGSKIVAYGCWKLEQMRKQEKLFLVEGESDCWAMWYHRVPTLGIPGADMVGKLAAEDLFGISLIYVCNEPGQSGKTFIPNVAQRLAELKWQGTAKMIQMPTGIKDPADLHCHFPNDNAFIAALDGCLKKSIPLPPAVQTFAPKKSQRAGAGQTANGANGSNGHHKPDILVTHQQRKVNDAAIKALLADPQLYQRDGLLVQVRSDSESGQSPQIVPLELATLCERMADVANWQKLIQTKASWDTVDTHPPPWSVAAVHARGEWEGMRRLKGVVEYPVLLPSGEVLSRPGYEPASHMMLVWPHTPLTIAAQPTRAQVTRAVDALEEVVADFPLAALEHAAAWYAALLTPLCRYAFSGPAPLFLVSGNTRGSGKSLLVQAILNILLGKNGTISPYPKDDAKRTTFITTMALGGQRYVFLDNLKGRFGDEVLDGVLTSTGWIDRMYHTQSNKEMQLRTVWYATGNNLQIVDDTCRRILPIRLETRLERPELRSGFKHALLLEWVRQERSRLLSAALTIVRGYAAAGRPPQKLQTWGSYAEWSELVRGALVWAGLPDPYTGEADTGIIVDDQRAPVAALLAYLEEVDQDGKGLSSAQILGLDPGHYHSEVHPRMKAILTELLGEKNLDANRVGRLLTKHVGSRLGGRYLRMKTIDGVKRWVVCQEQEDAAGGGHQVEKEST